MSEPHSGCVDDVASIGGCMSSFEIDGPLSEPLLDSGGAILCTPRARCATAVLLAAAAAATAAVLLWPSDTAGGAAENDYVARLFDAMTDEAIECNNFEFALCDISTCTVTSTTPAVAVCGCLEVPNSTATFSLGWSSPTMAASATYISWLGDYNTTLHGPTTPLLKDLEDEMCSLLPTLWEDDVGIAGAELVSIFGADADAGVDDAALEDRACSGIFGANCQGAPCFRQPYSGLWNVTCLCQVLSAGDANVSFAPSLVDDGCAVFSDDDDTACAVSTASYSEDLGQVEALIDIIKSSSSDLLDYAAPEACPITA